MRNSASESEYAIKSQRCDESEEVAVIPQSYTISNERAMMIELENAVVADSAVVGARWTVHFTSAAIFDFC